MAHLVAVALTFGHGGRRQVLDKLGRGVPPTARLGSLTAPGGLAFGVDQLVAIASAVIIGGRRLTLALRGRGASPTDG